MRNNLRLVLMLRHSFVSLENLKDLNLFKGKNETYQRPNKVQRG